MRKLSESVWGNLRKKSLGQEDRLEDNIEDLDRDGLYDYIFNVYEQTDTPASPLKGQTKPEDKSISLPLYMLDYTIYRLYISFYNGVINKVSLLAGEKEIREFKDELVKDFDIEPRFNGSLKITSKDGTVSNHMCLDLIDLVIANASKPLLKKREV